MRIYQGKRFSRATSLIKLKKNFFKIVRNGYQKEVEFCTDFKNVPKS
jgi:hypothetical protein